ncbi:hypothetical protein Tsubulata_046197 [Turnera subulata]|uniref:Bet v I/Major latex protein domain-containing protein n=1 Tax=Turnera subulata TaxID=218843 RepID=A0A9Q0J1W8_9ROSI|nr:hypothetical protein Tsubulata_046197 [Turnera subulata]
MVVYTSEGEVATSVPPAKLFKALVLEGNNIIPKALPGPHGIENLATIEGDGGPGSIKHATFGNETGFKYVKERVEHLCLHPLLSKTHYKKTILVFSLRVFKLKFRLIMGAFSYETEVTSTVAPCRLFKALVIDQGAIIPKVAPQAFKSIETLEGDGGPGSIKQINFADAKMFKVFVFDGMVPKLLPQDFESVVTLEGDGGPGTIKQVNFGKAKFNMGVVTLELETTTKISPAKMFEVLVYDGHNIIPKLLPEDFESIVTLEGDGGPGTIKQELRNIPVNSSGGGFKYVKERIDRVDKDNLFFSQTVSEGDALTDKFEKITVEYKFEASPGGGSICKNSKTFYTIGDLEIKEDIVKVNKDRFMAIFHGIEASLLENPAA